MATIPRRPRQETWIQYYWRPAMAWQYFVVCLFDFFFAPIMTSVLHAFFDPAIETWTPLTLQGGGLYHLAMGAIIGVASWSRGREKIQEMLTVEGIITSEESETIRQDVLKNKKPEEK